MRKLLVLFVLLFALRVSAQQYPAVLLYDSGGNPFPTGGGTPIVSNPPGVTCYTIVTGQTVPCVFSGGGSGTVNSGTANQLAYYATTGTAVSGTNALPNGTTATTQSPIDGTAKVATDNFVQVLISAGTPNSLTMNNSGIGSVSGTTFNGATPVTMSYNTIGAAGLAASNTFTGATTNDFSGTTLVKLPAATASSLLASGIVDGEAPVTLTTGTSCTLGTASGCNATAYDSGYTFNQNATAATAVTYTLPTAAAGKQYCVGNGNNGSAANTGVITLATSASGQFIVFTDGTLSATGGNVTSGGAAADQACVVGIDATHWQLSTPRGTWTKH